MRLSLKFGIDNVVKLRCYSEPKSRNGGDSQSTKQKLRKYRDNAELTQQLTYLKRLDAVCSNELQVYSVESRQLETIYRAEILREINRLTAGMDGRGGVGSLQGCPPATFDAVVAALDLLYESQRSIKPARFGHAHKATEFTARAKSSLRECGSILDANYKDNIYLVTLTLPSDGRNQFDLLARYSGYMINRLQRLFRNISNLQYYYVWEFQKRGALHLHYAIAHEDSEIAFKASRILRTQFYKVLRDIGSEHDIDMFASRTAPGGTWRNKPKAWQWSIDKITKSVTGYLSKYLSKGSLGFTDAFYPARWWGCCKSLRDTAKSYRVEITVAEVPNDIARQVFYHFIDTFDALNPALTVPFEHYIYNTLPVIDSLTGEATRIPTTSVSMSVIGVNFYFNPYNWLEEKYLDLREYFQGMTNPLLSEVESLQTVLLPLLQT